MIFLAPQLAKFALKFSSFEYFWLAIFGLSLSALVSAGNTLNGILAASLGMLISTVGLDIVSGAQRFTYGKNELMDGVQFIPVMIGLFGLSEVLRNLWRPSISKSSQDHLKSTKSSRIPFKRTLNNNITFCRCYINWFFEYFRIYRIKFFNYFHR